MDNSNYCRIISHADHEAIKQKEAEENFAGKIGKTKLDMYLTTLFIVIIAFTTAVTFGAIFYQRSKWVKIIFQNILIKKIFF